MATIQVGRKPLGQFTLKFKGFTALDLKPGPQTVAWEAIRSRPDIDTRTLDPRHVLSLARSIAAVGLIQPIAIDAVGRLIAGGHRLAVWALLCMADGGERRVAFLKGLAEGADQPAPSPEAEEMATEIAELDIAGWKEAHPKGLVPVLVFDADASRLKNKALLREVAENEKRRSYTTAEVKTLADRLRKAGFVDLEGRPTAEQASVRKELASILGKSSRQVRRILNDPEIPKANGRRSVTRSHPALLLRNLSRMLATIERALAKDKDARQVLDAAAQLSKYVAAYQANSSRRAAGAG